jgi:hypothetical protein
MIVVPDKYVDTPDYTRVYKRLLEAAREGEIVYYLDVAKIMGLAMTAADLRREVAHLLAEISQNEHYQGRPMLSAIVVSSKNAPVAGFFELAHHFGKLKMRTPEAETHFWEEEKAAVYEKWGK